MKKYSALAVKLIGASLMMLLLSFILMLSPVAANAASPGDLDGELIHPNYIPCESIGWYYDNVSVVGTGFLADNASTTGDIYNYTNHNISGSVSSTSTSSVNWGTTIGTTIEAGVIFAKASVKVDGNINWTRSTTTGITATDPAIPPNYYMHGVVGVSATWFQGHYYHIAQKRTSPWCYVDKDYLTVKSWFPQHNAQPAIAVYEYKFR